MKILIASETAAVSEWIKCSTFLFGLTTVWNFSSFWLTRCVKFLREFPLKFSPQTSHPTSIGLNFLSLFLPVFNTQSFNRKFAVSSHFYIFSLSRPFQDLQTNRTLTLISKTIQSLGNLVSSRSAQQHAKEEFTVELYKKFCTEKHVEAVKKFLDAISTMDSREVESCGVIEPIMLKDG